MFIKYPSRKSFPTLIFEVFSIVFHNRILFHSTYTSSKFLLTFVSELLKQTDPHLDQAKNEFLLRGFILICVKYSLHIKSLIASQSVFIQRRENHLLKRSNSKVTHTPYFRLLGKKKKCVKFLSRNINCKVVKLVYENQLKLSATPRININIKLHNVGQKKILNFGDSSFRR